MLKKCRINSLELMSHSLSQIFYTSIYKIHLFSQLHCHFLSIYLFIYNSSVSPSPFSLSPFYHSLFYSLLPFFSLPPFFLSLLTLVSPSLPLLFLPLLPPYLHFFHLSLSLSLSLSIYLSIYLSDSISWFWISFPIFLELS